MIMMIIVTIIDTYLLKKLILKKMKLFEMNIDSKDKFARGLKNKY